jgi:hypothetical protein
MGAPYLSRRALLWGGACSGLCFPLRSFAAAPQDIYFAGLAYISKHADIAVLLPNVSALLGSGAEFDARLAKGARSFNGSFRLIVDELDTLKPGQPAYVMALAFDRETVDTERIDGRYKLFVEISFQVLVFDYRTMSIVATLPAATQYIDTVDQVPDGTMIEEAFSHLLFGQQADAVSGLFWKTVAGLSLPNENSRTLKVKRVDISPQALTQIETYGMGEPQAFSDQIGNSFGKFLCANQHISILPYASSQAVGNKMAARLSNGSVFNLTIPDSDYDITLSLDGFKKIQVAEANAGRGFIYGVFVTITVAEPLSSKVYFGSQVKLGAPRVVPAGASDANDGPAFSEVMQQMFFEFTQAISTADSAWTKSHLVPPDPSAKSMKSLKEIIELCR